MEPITYPMTKHTGNTSLEEVVVVDGIWVGHSITDHPHTHMAMKQPLARSQQQSEFSEGRQYHNLCTLVNYNTNLCILVNCNTNLCTLVNYNTNLCTLVNYNTNLRTLVNYNTNLCTLVNYNTNLCTLVNYNTNPCTLVNYNKSCAP